MVLPNRFSQTTPRWYDQPMPSFEDYADNPLGYEQAVHAWVAQRNGERMFAPDSYDPVTGFNIAGSSNPATQGEYNAGYLNSRLASAAGQVARGNADHPNAQQYLLAMQNRFSIRPEEAQSAYDAARAGIAGPSPILNDSILNLLESMGYGPSVTSGTGSPGPETGVERGGRPDQVKGTLPTTGPGGGDRPNLPPFTPPDFVPMPRPGMPPYLDPTNQPYLPGSSMSQPGGPADSSGQPWLTDGDKNRPTNGQDQAGGAVPQNLDWMPASMIQPNADLSAFINRINSYLSENNGDAPPLAHHVGGNPATQAAFLEFIKRRAMGNGIPAQPAQVLATMGY